jgi:hypothetical protein
MFANAVNAGTGKQKHLLRQEIWEILGGKKNAGIQMTDTLDRAYQAIRKGISDVLDTKNAAYKAENLRFARASDPITRLQKLMKSATGTEEDILNMSAGLLARRLTSNAMSGPQIRNILRSIDAILKSGTKLEEAVQALQDLFNILDKYFKLSGGTSFKGQIESATGIGETIGKVLKATAGETPEVRQQALEKLLKDLLSPSKQVPKTK